MKTNLSELIWVSDKTKPNMRASLFLPEKEYFFK